MNNFIEDVKIYGNKKSGPITRYTRIIRIEDDLGRSIKPVIEIKIEQNENVVVIDANGLRSIRNLFYPPEVIEVQL